MTTRTARTDLDRRIKIATSHAISSIEHCAMDPHEAMVRATRRVDEGLDASAWMDLQDEVTRRIRRVLNGERGSE